LGVQCEVVAPTLVPVKAGDRVKTDRRDAEKLARCYRSGDLTAVWVPDEGSEALRDLVRAREAAKQDQMRARHRLSKFLLRSGQRPPTGVRPWTRPYLIWVAQLRFPQVAQEATRQDYLHEVEHMRERVARLEQAIMEAVKLASPALQQVINDLQALRGIADISAVTIAAELGQVSRFGPATRTCDESLAKQHGAIVVHQVSGMDCADDRRAFRKRSRRLHGGLNTACTSAIGSWGQPASPRERSLLQSPVNCWDSSGLLEPEQRRPSASELRPDKNKSKKLSK
jgi:hypothetical protein